MTMIGTIFAVGGLAFVDSLNPFTIAGMAIVIAKNNSLVRGGIFVCGTFIAYFLGGVLIFNGWVAAMKALLPLITPTIALVGWTILGFLSLAGALYLWLRMGNKPINSKPQDNPAALISIFVFALVGTASDLPTALPFFGAMPLILATKPSIFETILWLGFYCFIYVSPLLLLLWLKLVNGARLEPVLVKVNGIMDWIIGRLCPPLLVMLALYCIANAVPTLQ